jgi:signal recognition particle receptor subunit beta
MVVFNYSGAEINAKVVYYGPALSGKTTNLEYIYEQMPNNAKGKMVSMKTRTDRTLFFDFLPLELGEINGYRTRILLYTVPGQVYYNATRKLVLKGADAVVFVADSSPRKMDENVESLRNLEDNLNEHGLTLDTMPWVMQYNKRDLSDALPVESLNQKLNLLNVPSYEATATTGEGIYETFQAIARMLYGQLTDRLEKAQPAPRAGQPQSPPPPPVDPAQAGKRKVPPPPRPAAPRPVQAPGAPDPTKNVTDVIDVALREVSDGDDSASRAAASKKKPKGKQKSEDDFKFEQMDKPQKEDTEVGRVSDFDENGKASPEANDSNSDFVLDPFPNQKAPPETPNEDEEEDSRIHDIPTPEQVSEPSQTLPENDIEVPRRPPRVPAPPPDDASRDVTISVPVTLSRWQVGKTIPIKIELEIEFVDDE